MSNGGIVVRAVVVGCIFFCFLVVVLREKLGELSRGLGELSRGLDRIEKAVSLLEKEIKRLGPIGDGEDF